MTQDPSTGQGYDAVEVGSSDYFDPNAQDPNFPGDTGLQIRKHTYWQGDVQFDTFETIGPVYGPKWPQGTLRAGGLGISDYVFGLSNKQPPTTDPHNYGIPGRQGLAGPDSADGSVDGLFPLPGGGFVSPQIVCDPDGIFGPLQGVDTNDIQILLQGCYKEGGGTWDIYIPVPPEELTADFPQNNDGDTDTLAGEITIPGTERLESIGWTSFFPRDYNPSYVTVPVDFFPDPRTAIVSLIWTKRFGMPITLTISGTPWSDLVVIKTLKWTYKAGEPGDIYYDIQFKRYRSAQIATVVLPNAPTEPKDYPSYQGPPSNAQRLGPEPVLFLNPSTGQYEMVRGVDSSDGTNPEQIPVDPGGTQADTSNIIGPQPDATGAQPGINLTSPQAARAAPPPTVTTIVTYNVVAKFNWGQQSMLTGQNLNDVYETVKSWSPQNTMQSIMDMNKDAPADNHRGETVLSDYKPFDNLPWNTPIKVYKTSPAPNSVPLSPQNVAAGS